MKTKINDVIDEVLDYVDGNTYTTAEGLAKDIKSLGYVVTEIVSGDYVAFKVKGTDLSFLAFLSDKKPYYCFDVDTDITFDDDEDDDKNDKKKKKTPYDRGTYSVNYGKDYIY